MRTLQLIFNYSILFLLATTLTTGCGSGRPTADRKTDAEYEAEGMVKNENGAWIYPESDMSEGYGDDYAGGVDEDESDSSDDSDDGYEDDAGYRNEYPQDNSDVDEETDEEDIDNVDEDVASSRSDDDGYGNSGPGAGYNDAGYSDYGNDPYATGPRGNPKDYAKKVEPILRAHCYNCHGGGPRGKKGGLALHSPNAIKAAMQEVGDLIISGDPDGSELIYRVTAEPGEDRMPPRGPGLSEEEVSVLKKWIQDGASFGDAPADADPVASTNSGDGGYGEGGGDGYGGGYGDGYDGYGRGGDDGGYGEEGERGPQRPTPPQNLAEFANRSFQRGRDSQAMRQLYAQALVKSDTGKSILSKYRWVPGLKRATLAVRWGVGIKYHAKSGYKGRPRPVGVVQDLPDDKYNNIDEEEKVFGDFKNQTLDYYAGDVGAELLLRLQNRIERGDYGEILKEQLDNRLTKGDDEDDFYDDDDGYESGYGGRSGGGYGSGYGGGDGGDSSEKPDGDKIEQLMPGVTLVGVGGNAALLERARKENIDVLIIFDVVADPNNRLRIVHNSTRVRAYDVLSEEAVAVSGKINNIEIQKKLADDPEDETILNEMDKVFSAIDTKYRCKPFPKATSEKAKKSVLSFVSNTLKHPSADPLWKLGEVRFYESEGALSSKHADIAYNKILPSMASKIKNVSDDKEMNSLLAKWLDVEPEPQESDDEEFDDEEDRPKKRTRTFR